MGYSRCENPVKIMLDGMTDKPIAIPFPFSIGEYTIGNPDDWHRFKRINAELDATATRRMELLKRVIEQEGMIVFAAPGCECEDCDLVREIEKELADG